MKIVSFETNMGNIDIEVDEQLCPVTAKNFIDYANAGFYDKTIFHRVIAGFMVQGGGLEAGMQNKETQEPIKNEANKGLKNTVGTVAMARTSDPHSATCQFFINVADNDFLDFRAETMDGWGYCAFAKVINGMDLVQKISKVNTVNRSGHRDVPEQDIVIQNTRVTSKSEVTETE